MFFESGQAVRSPTRASRLTHIFATVILLREEAHAHRTKKFKSVSGHGGSLEGGRATVAERHRAGQVAHAKCNFIFVDTTALQSGHSCRSLQHFVQAHTWPQGPNAMEAVFSKQIVHSGTRS